MVGISRVLRSGGMRTTASSSTSSACGASGLPLGLGGSQPAGLALPGGGRGAAGGALRWRCWCSGCIRQRHWLRNLGEWGDGLSLAGQKRDHINDQKIPVCSASRLFNQRRGTPRPASSRLLRRTCKPQKELITETASAGDGQQHQSGPSKTLIHGNARNRFGGAEGEILVFKGILPSRGRHPDRTRQWRCSTCSMLAQQLSGTGWN